MLIFRFYHEHFCNTEQQETVENYCKKVWYCSKNNNTFVCYRSTKFTYTFNLAGSNTHIAVYLLLSLIKAFSNTIRFTLILPACQYSIIAFLRVQFQYNYFTIPIRKMFTQLISYFSINNIIPIITIIFCAKWRF